MIDAGNLLKELDDALDKVVAKKEPESFLKPSTLKIEEYKKSIRQIQAQFTDAPKFNEESTYPQFLSCGLLHVRGKNGTNMEFYCLKFILSPLKACI
ncbi:cell division protein [Helicobacter pylori]|nr:cell division protein [Helicobacter pylori]WQX62337.1 cell division protein [Helicobacter pylori]